jgi:heptaprenyl diphosphate synthase
MPLPINRERIKKIALLGILLAFTLIMSLVERMVPLDGVMPGMRLGLANLAIVISLYTFPPRDTIILVILKCLMTAFFSGSMIALFYSLTGSVASLAIMLLLVKAKNVSVIGVSVAGAALHNIGQIAVARLIFGSWGILIYLPLLLAVGTASGIIIGILAKLIQPRMTAYLKANTL